VFFRAEQIKETKMAYEKGSQAHKVQEVVSRILTDPAFSAQVQKDGLAALKGGAGSAAWNTYFEHFAPTPGALSNLVGGANAANCTCNSNTIITLSTLVTPIPTCCGLTTTTTVSGN
jgi:hypothetical protein